MAKYKDADLITFMNLVKHANKSFRESASSLNALCKLLRKESMASQIMSAIAAIPPGKQQQYSAALTHLKSTFPGLQILGGFQAREAKVQTRYLTRQITQTQGPQNYAWDVKLTFEDRPTVLIVRPVIRYRAKPNDPHSHNPSKQELDTWKAQIQLAWRAKFLVNGTAKDVAFEINFVAWDSPAGQQAYQIEVVDIPVREALEKKLVQQGVMAQGSTLQAQHWKVKEQARRLTLDGGSLGTPHLQQWGVADMQAIVHEFGHAIGNPDEYLVTAHNVNYGGHSLTYNFQPFTRDSLMNDTKQAKIYKRHFAVVADLYRNWKTPQGGLPPQIVITQPSA